MATVKVRDEKSLDAAIKKWKKMCSDEGIFQELRKRAYYEKPTEERRRKKRIAVIKQRELHREQMAGEY